MYIYKMENITEKLQHSMEKVEDIKLKLTDCEYKEIVDSLMDTYNTHANETETFMRYMESQKTYKQRMDSIMKKKNELIERSNKIINALIYKSQKDSLAARINQNNWKNFRAGDMALTDYVKYTEKLKTQSFCLSNIYLENKRRRLILKHGYLYAPAVDAYLIPKADNVDLKCNELGFQMIENNISQKIPLHYCMPSGLQ